MKRWQICILTWQRIPWKIYPWEMLSLVRIPLMRTKESHRASINLGIENQEGNEPMELPAQPCFGLVSSKTPAKVVYRLEVPSGLVLFLQKLVYPKAIILAWTWKIRRFSVISFGPSLCFEGQISWHFKETKQKLLGLPTEKGGKHTPLK